MDGSNRVSVISTSTIPGGYAGLSNPQIWNGVFTIDLKQKRDGKIVNTTYYYKLDGSMDQFELSENGSSYWNDGDHFLTPGVTENGVECVRQWDPDTDSRTFLTEWMGMGYYGVTEAYYLRDGVVYKRTYATGQEEALLDTGLTDAYRLCCFPDCMAVYSGTLQNTQPSGEEPAEQFLHFYNWDFQSLGSVKIDYPWSCYSQTFICGETENRIYLTDNVFYIPRYYIEKSDFATGEIAIRKLNQPDFDVEYLDALANEKN